MTTTEPTITPATEREFLTGWGTFDELGSSVRPLLFGQMLVRAKPIVQHYASDLYHDAMKIAAITGPTTFWWGPRECGTDWYNADPIAEKLVYPDKTRVLYEVRLFCTNRDNPTGLDGAWYADFTTLDPEGAWL